MKPDDVTNCMRCNDSLDRGYSSRWVGDECKEVICFCCDKVEAIADHMKTGIITTHFMMDSMMDVYHLVDGDVYNETRLNEILNQKHSRELKAKVAVQLVVAKLKTKIKDFDSRVWFRGLQDQILKTQCRGVSAKHKNFSVLTWTCAGRTMITIEDDKAMVTAVADETSKESRTGLHGIRATGEQAIELIDRAISLYETGYLQFQDDKQVSML